MIYRVVFINLGILLVLLVIAELIFGNWLWGPNYGAMNIPRNVDRYFDTSGLYKSGGRSRYSRDALGLRGPYDDAGRIDVLTIGGSTTNQLFIDDDKTWQAHMRRRFSEAGKPAIVVDASVDGQSARGHIAAFDRWLSQLPGLKAKYVLAYVGINDVALDDAAIYDSMEATDASRRFRNAIANKSALYALFRTIRGMIRAREMHLVHGSAPIQGLDWGKYRPVEEPAPPDPARERDLAAYAERLTVLIGRIRAFGSKAVLVTQPTAEFRVRDGWVWVPRNRDGGLNPSGFHIMDRFNRVTMSTCRAAGAICVDLARTVAFEEGDFYDRVHNTPAGTRKVGEFLYRQLKDRLH